MPTFEHKTLLRQLRADVQAAIHKLEALRELPDATLRHRPAEGSWSPVEIIDHLNFYAGYYTQAMAKAVQGAKETRPARFRGGWLGHYFTRIIGPAPEGEQLTTKMRSPRDARPAPPAELDPQAGIKQLLEYQEALLRLLNQAEHIQLDRYRVPISLSRFIRLRLGDTFRFVIAHQQRHFQQLDRAIQGVSV